MNIFLLDLINIYKLNSKTSTPGGNEVEQSKQLTKYYLVLILYKLNRHQTVVSYLVDRLCQHIVGLVCTYEYIHIHISNTYEKMKMCILPTEFHISAIVDAYMYI